MKYKILIIEDSRTFNNTLKRALNELASEIKQAFTFAQAQEFLEKEEFDFIFLDLILPDGEGDELLELLSKKDRNKTIVLSADEDIQRRVNLFEVGILDYFSKLNPINLILNDIKNLISSLETNSEINLLVIDDSSFMRRKLNHTLSPRKYNIFLSESAENGLEILKENEIHLILLDVELVGMNGTEFLEKIKQQKEFANIPVIAISGNDSPHLISRLLKHGASDFIKKPFIIEQLLLKCELHIKSYKNLQLLKQKTIELKKAEETKSIFLANMSHEIRTPLNAILGFISLLKHKEMDKESEEYLNIMNDSAQTLLGILNNILDFSKLEVGKLKTEMIEFNPKKEFSSIIDLFQLKAQDKNIHLEKNFKNLPEIIKSDPTRLKQVLMNLISNAIKFSPNNSKVEVNIEYKNSKLYVSVVDEGIGLDKYQQENIFEAFTQADESISRKFGGSGLGLNISSKIVELLGGKLKIESKPNEGSKFYFTIPIIEAKQNSKKVETLKIFKGKVLIVEDNKANQLFLKVILSKFGVEVDVADNGKEAIEKIKQNSYDLVLMDENMPVMNGSDALKEIRKFNKEIPIISVSANLVMSDKEHLLKCGFNDFIPKPVNIELLQKILDNYLNET